MLKGTFLAHGQLGLHEDPQVLYCKTELQLGGSQQALWSQLVPLQLQNLTFSLIDLHEVTVVSFLQHVEVL